MRGGHIIKHWSSTQKVVALSPGEAEFAGIVKGSAEGIGLQSVAMDLGFDFGLKVFTDSSAAIGICRRTGIGRVRHLVVGQLWVQERNREGDFTLHKHPGLQNPGDLLTKHVVKSTLGYHCHFMGVVSEEGRAQSAPLVDGWVPSAVGWTNNASNRN